MLLEGLETLCLLASRAPWPGREPPLHQPVGGEQAHRPAGAAPRQEAHRARWPPYPPHPQAGAARRVAPKPPAEMKGCWRTARILTDHTPLPVACSETLLAGYLPALCTTRSRSLTSRSPPTTPLSSWRSPRRGRPARHLRRSAAAGPRPVRRAAAGGALLPGGR